MTDNLNPRDPSNYLNREMSWLAFNQRVLEEAETKSNPVLERLKFLTIFSGNLDEFFMVRIAGLKKVIQEDIAVIDSPDEQAAEVTLKACRERIRGLMARHEKCLKEDVLPELAKSGIAILKSEELTEAQTAHLDRYFTDHVYPILTPMAVDPAHPFPFLGNLSLYILVTLRGERDDTGQAKPIALIELPSVLPRLLQADPTDDKKFFPLEDLVKRHLSTLFIGFKIDQAYVLRLTRNLDYQLLENEVVDLLKSIQKEMVTREHKEAVRLEIEAGVHEQTIERLTSVLSLTADDVYLVSSPLFTPSYRTLLSLPVKELKDPPFNPRLPKRMESSQDIFSLIAEEDILIHHPYESFYSVMEFLTSAASDPAVLAVKQTLYRTSGDSPIIDALIAAAENGKHVTALIELKARFDEKNNILWARRLERAGVNVVFGFVGLKTHCKATMVIRREMGKLVRYIHLATGNYNSTTAKLYTDIGFFTDDEAIGEDISSVFNLLTGFNIMTGEQALTDKSAFPRFRKLAVSPLSLRERFNQLIDREIANKKAGGEAKIFAKMNALVDREIIAKLYEASMAGVKIDLMVRGICSLKPQVPGLSDTIEVRSIVDRFLEHSRIFYFHAGGIPEVYLSSADWMTRNLERRIEILFPIENPKLRQRLIDEIIGTYWRDNVKARVLGADGRYAIRTPKAGEEPFRAQEKLIQIVREGGIQSLPYDQAIRHTGPTKTSRRPVVRKSKQPPKKPTFKPPT